MPSPLLLHTPTALEYFASLVAEDDGLPLLVFSFHSPSLRPGHTPYVRDEDDLDRFYAWWRASFDYLAHRGIKSASVKQIIAAAEV